MANKTKKLLDVVIKRSKWARGSTHGIDLYTYYGTKCCLGFLGIVCGYKTDTLRNTGTPEIVLRDIMDGVLNKRKNKWPSSIVTKKLRNSKLTDKLMHVNDDCKIDEFEREKEVHRLGLLGGINFTFVD